MRNLILTIVALLMGSMAAEAQTSKAEAIGKIRKIYAEAKKAIADNGKNGMAPLDIKITTNSGTKVSDDFIINEISELTFYFSKYRIDSSLDYPDASSCYFVTENWSANGHISYREVLFDPNEGNLLFSYMRAETHAGFVIESRYYYGADGQLIEQKHKVGGKEASDNSQSWSTAEGDKELASKYLEIFEMLMNQKNKTTTQTTVGKTATGDATRMKFIRDTYAKAKEKVEQNNKSELPFDLQIVIRDQSWGPPEVTDLKFYFDVVTNQPGSDNTMPSYYCYFASEHHHNNQMGFDFYNEYLFKPNSHDLIFNYTRALEENTKNEWRYYYDDNGNCIEVKTDAEEHDNGANDKQTARRYLTIFDKLCEATIR
ncbi:MAG: hypothetical protein K5893_07430 [Prevotella sp.]|nr:hypothetical protein [Prevotella sp.]